MKAKILPNTMKAFTGSWRLYLLYMLLYGPILILGQVVSAFGGGQPTADTETALLMLAAYCCLILVLLVYVFGLLAAIPFYTTGFAGALREAFFERPVTLKAIWQTGKKEYGRSFGLFGIYAAATIPFTVAFAIALLIIIGTGGITEAEMISGDYIYSNPFIIAGLVLLSAFSAFASIWFYGAAGALVSGAGKFRIAALAPFRIAARFPEHIVPFVLAYLVYSLLMFSANMLLPQLIPYSEWGILAVNLFVGPAIHLLVISFLVATAVEYFNVEEETIDG